MLALGCSNDHNMLGNVAFTVIPGFDIYPKLFAKLQCCHVRPPIMALDKRRRWKTRKCIAFAFVLCHLENTPSHINKNRELKQRGRECQRECYKTIDLITEYNHFMWECNHLAHRSPKNKRNVGICWAKLVSNWTQHMPTSCNIGQHGVQTNATCCAQHVGTTCCVRLHGP